MIRIYDSLARYFQLLLKWQQDNGEDVESTRRYISRNYGRDSGRYSAHLMNAYAATDNMEYNTSEKISVLLDKLLHEWSQKSSASADSTIIEMLVQMLSQPWGRNAISTSTLKALRRAILLPSELADLRETLDHVELHCSGCGRSLGDGEAVTYTRGAGTTEIFCFLCRHPSLTPCQCGDWNPIDKAVGKMLVRAKPCPHTGKAKPTSGPTSGAEAGAELGARLEQAADGVIRGIPQVPPTAAQQSTTLGIPTQLQEARISFAGIGNDIHYAGVVRDRPGRARPNPNWGEVFNNAPIQATHPTVGVWFDENDPATVTTTAAPQAGEDD